jgi:dihydropyrimidinase
MKVDYCTFEGVELTGYPDTVISRGRVLVHKGEQRIQGGGRFIKRARTGELLR